MATMVKSFAIQGIEAYEVDIEVKTMDGQPMVSVIGLGDQAVREASERIQSAIDESGYEFPKKRVIISLAPSDKKKRGSHFDLAMAIGVLQQEEAVGIKNLTEYGIIGELALNGNIRPCQGLLPMVIAAKKAGFQSVIVPRDNMEEAKLVQGIKALGFANIKDVIRFLEGKSTYEEENIISQKTDLEDVQTLDFAEVRGQDEVIEAVMIAAAGGHNMLMIGEPGCGKTMIAQRIPTILPEMTEEECLEVTKIYSISGAIRNNNSLIRNRPFRAPHHNASQNALIGGGANAMPGEVSLAHNGVLFLDELPEFPRRVLDSLRQPIEDNKVSIARVNGMHTYPSNFMFIAAMNPCPCGYYPEKKCRCSDYEVMSYRGKISGPIMDRVDLQIHVHAVNFFEMENQKHSRSSKEIRAIVTRARKIQQTRFSEVEGVNCNAQMGAELIKKYCVLDGPTLDLLKETSEKYGYSVRTIHKIMKVARTCADINQHEDISYSDMEKALSCRDLDKSTSQLLVVKDGGNHTR